MDADQSLIDAFNAREDVRKAVEWQEKKAVHQRYENAAREAHKVRNMLRLVRFNNADIRDWNDLPIGSQNHLIADAENVSANASITETELRRLYHERLIAGGDTDNTDLGAGDKTTPDCHEIEELVLNRLKECLAVPVI